MTLAARGPHIASFGTRRELAEQFSTCARLYSEAVVRLTGVSSHYPNFQRLSEAQGVADSIPGARQASTSASASSLRASGPSAAPN